MVLNNRLQRAFAASIALGCTTFAAAQTPPIRLQRLPIAPLPSRPQPQVQAQALPDLLVAAIREEGPKIAADIRNAGAGPAGATKVTLYVAGRQVSELDLAPLAAGATQTVRFDRPAGATAVQVMVDRPNLVAESNEANNRPPNFALTEQSALPFAASRAITGRPAANLPQTMPLQAAPRPALPPRPAPIAAAPAQIVAPSTPMTEILPPSTVNQAGFQGVLKPVRFSQMVSGLGQAKPLSIASLRANPVVMLDGQRLDFRPVLNNPNGLPIVAQRLRGQPQLGTVLGEQTDVVEVSQGLLVHNFLSYRLKPGVCTDPRRAGAARSIGARCSSTMNDSVRAKAMADPADPHYIADSKKRSAVLFQSSINAANQMDAIRKYLPQLRANLATPAAAGQLGGTEAARLAALGDSQLLDEIAGTAVVNTEEIVLIPKFQPVPAALLSGLAPKSHQVQLSDWAKKSPVKPLTGHHDLTTQYFLTGFTTGRAYEWRKRAEVTIDWCVVGCSETYYAEVYATFDYAFGLRFPMQLGGTYDFVNGHPFVTPVFQPINGDKKVYELTGLPADQIHDGKEFVAEVGFSAGLNVKVPILGTRNIGAQERIDFTDFLDAPFVGGNLTAPAEGKTSAPMVKVIDKIDLLGGRADFGIAGARVHPIIQVQLQSTDLHFTLRDTRINSEMPIKSGQKKELSFDPNTHVSQFTIGDPVYGMDFLITPGIRPLLFVDVAVWSYDWHADLIFPQFALKLPPAGATFTCHANTVCARNYEFSPEVAKETQGAMAAEDYTFDQKTEAPPNWFWGPKTADKRPGWAYSFDQTFMGQCPPKDVHGECKSRLRQLRVDALLAINAAPLLSRDKFKGMTPSIFITQKIIDAAIEKDALQRFDAITAEAQKSAVYAIGFYKDRYK